MWTVPILAKNKWSVKTSPRSMHIYCHPSEIRQRDNSAVTIEIARADFRDPRLAAFLQDHLNELAPTAPPETRHALNLDALRASTVRLWIAREGADVAGTGALAALEPDHEEFHAYHSALRFRPGDKHPHSPRRQK
jgi:hypothetical protein